MNCLLLISYIILCKNYVHTGPTETEKTKNKNSGIKCPDGIMIVSKTYQNCFVKINSKYHTPIEIITGKASKEFKVGIKMCNNMDLVQVTCVPLLNSTLFCYSK